MFLGLLFHFCQGAAKRHRVFFAGWTGLFRRFRLARRARVAPTRGALEAAAQHSDEERGGGRVRGLAGGTFHFPFVCVFRVVVWWCCFVSRPGGFFAIAFCVFECFEPVFVA